MFQWTSPWTVQRQLRSWYKVGPITRESERQRSRTSKVGTRMSEYTWPTIHDKIVKLRSWSVQIMERFTEHGTYKLQYAKLDGQTTAVYSHYTDIRYQISDIGYQTTHFPCQNTGVLFRSCVYKYISVHVRLKSSLLHAAPRQSITRADSRHEWPFR